MKKRLFFFLMIGGMALGAGFALAEDSAKGEEGKKAEEAKEAKKPAARSAAPAAETPRRGWRRGRWGKRGWWRQLSPAKREQLRQLRIKHLRQMAPLRATLRLRRVELAAEMTSDKPDAAKLKAKTDAVLTAKRAVMNQRIQNFLALKKILGPKLSQRLDMRIMRRAMKGRRWGKWGMRRWRRRMRRRWWRRGMRGRRWQRRRRWRRRGMRRWRRRQMRRRMWRRWQRDRYDRKEDRRDRD